MKNKILLIFFSITSFVSSVKSQIDCNTTDINKAAGKWVWQKKGYGSQWQLCDPIRKEMQRIMPVALDGLHATNSIAFGDISAVPNTPAAPKYYECYLMLKKYECLKGYNILQPEGETGCWVYFVMNSIFQGGASFQDGLHFGYYQNEGGLYVGDFYTEIDAGGNKILYVSTFSRLNLKRGYYFSAQDRLPIRKISWKELILSYKTFTEKEITGKLNYTKEGLAKNKKELGATKYEDTKKYLANLIEDRKKEIIKLEDDRTVLLNWYNNLLQHKNINEIARVTQTRLEKKVIEQLINSSNTGGTFPVWIEDISFFDLSKPKDQPQCIYFSFRRQDDNLPKKNFMDLFFSTFNMDVLMKMTGGVAVKPTSANIIDASLKEAKTATKENQNTVSDYLYSFDNSPLNQFPAGWQGMNNITVQQFENANWLALTKDGYWYPKQYNKEIKDNFCLSFDLRWNKDIAYNSGSFAVSFCSLAYDNAAEIYKPDGPANIMSLYDSYTGGFNRVMLWFDPYANNGGNLTIYSYARNESLVASKKITLPGFYLTMNNQQVKLQRKGNSLIVFINDKKEVEVENIFIPLVQYNLYTFSRYKGNNSDNKNDVFYLTNIKTTY
ncbi:MAG: hypothetical protein J0L56_08175 [Chitinophagales bacterium]|nr:hypothetical protein [Chitinophagales bacterium]